MNKRILFCIILFLGCCRLLTAQNSSDRLHVHGIVMDAVTGEAIEFANIGILGTTKGVASGMDGEFSLDIPKGAEKFNIIFSVVGYARFEIKVGDAVAQSPMTVKLQPISFKINEFTVEAQSLMYIRMIQRAVENISKNYYTTPHSYVGYFEYKTQRNETPLLEKEAVVSIYDSRGYHRSDVLTTFNELHYTYNEVRRKTEPKNIYDKLTYFDDILTADIVRHTRNVLDVENLNEFSLRNGGRVLYEGDSVQVISYALNKPTPTTSGDAGVTKLTGRIYINMNDHAVIKNEMDITSRDFNILGRNLIPADSSPKENVEMTITSNYRKVQSKYILSGSSITYKYQEGGDTFSGRMNYVTTRINTDTPNVLKGRVYYEEIKANPRFWNTYTVYFEE